jgi:hypothetical protein
LDLAALEAVEEVVSIVPSNPEDAMIYDMM